MLETIAVSSLDRPKICGAASEVLRVLVVGAQADVDADVVQQARRPEEQPLACRQPVVVVALVEQPHREHRDVTAVRAIEPVSVSDRLGAGQHLALEVLGAQAAAGRREVEQHAGPQRRVGDDEAGAPSFPTAACGRPAGPARAFPPRPPGGGTDRPAAPRPAARPSRRRRGRRRASPRARHRPLRSRGSAMPRTARRRRSRPYA